MAHSFRVRGQQSLTRQLRKLPEAAQREVKEALREGAELVQRDAVAMVPVKTGNLRKILSSPRAVRIRKGGLQVVFGITGAKAGRDGFYARFVEFGTKGYSAGQRRRSGADKGGKVKYQRMKRSVPARPARPFMRPAFFKNRLAIRERIRAAVRRALQRNQ